MLKNGFVAFSLLVAACATDGQDGTTGPQGPAGQTGSDGDQGAMGTPGTPGMVGPAGPQLAMPAVYTLSNEAGGNQVAAYLRASNGNLSRFGRFTTGANGTGTGLGSQGALVFDA
ncbi:MAG TPA: hypothetical protein VIV40_27840, partial [Kofleriaceae bacterium]